jgi:putative transposase
MIRAFHGVPLPGVVEGFGRPARGSLASIMRQYKSSVTRQVTQKLGGVPAVWQRGYYEHVIRDHEDWQRIRLYIEANPANWLHDEENPGDQRPRRPAWGHDMLCFHAEAR